MRFYALLHSRIAVAGYLGWIAQTQILLQVINLISISREKEKLILKVLPGVSRIFFFRLQTPVTRLRDIFGALYRYSQRRLRLLPPNHSHFRLYFSSFDITGAHFV